MTDEEFNQRCAARLAEVDSTDPNVIARLKAFNDTLSKMRVRHAILMQLDETTIYELQHRAILIDANEGKATFHTNMFDKTFYKHNKPRIISSCL